jgi:nitrogen fixation protein FixH
VLSGRPILLSAMLAVTLALFPACSKKESSQPQSSVTSSTADATVPWRLNLKISPDRPSMTKPVTFMLHIADNRGRPVNDARVSGGLTMKLMDMGVTQVSFVAKGNGDYEASMKSLDMSGPWGLAIEATQGSTNVKKNYDVTVFD